MHFSRAGFAFTGGILGIITMRLVIGQLLAIVGEEGCGKRALLRTMIGVEAPAGGDLPQ